MKLLNSSLFLKFALPITAFFAVCIIAMALLVPNLLKQNVIDSAVASATEIVAQFKVLRQYYSENVVKALSDREDIEFSVTHKQDGSLPLPATVVLDMSELLQDRGITLKLYSPYPFPNRKGRTLDQIAQEAWAYLTKNPDRIYTKYVQINGKHIVRIAMPDIMNSESCVSCHNNHPDSSKQNWELGDVGGVLEVTTDVSAAVASAMRTSRWVILGIVGLAIAVVGFAYYVFKKRITRPLVNASAAAKNISEGDLTVSINHVSQDEVGVMLGALQDMQDRLAAVVTNVRGQSESVSAGADQIASGNNELSTRTQEQAANLEETAASMEQIASTVKQNADNAARADQLACGVRTQAEEGGAVIGRAVTAMDEINEASRKIVGIIGLIDGIAFQTNLLALNASVEAARAGEQGRGFAVVASEVRNLASRSASAAKDIKDLVSDSAVKVGDGAKQVSLSGKTLEEIVESISKVSDIVSEIASASSEQSSGIDQVNQAVSQMDNMTRQNASLVQESSAASQSLAEQSNVLMREVAFFKLAGDSQGAHAEAYAAEAGEDCVLSGAPSSDAGVETAAEGASADPRMPAQRPATASPAPLGRPRLQPSMKMKSGLRSGRHMA